MFIVVLLVPLMLTPRHPPPTPMSSTQLYHLLFFVHGFFNKAVQLNVRNKVIGKKVTTPQVPYMTYLEHALISARYHFLQRFSDNRSLRKSKVSSISALVYFAAQLLDTYDYWFNAHSRFLPILFGPSGP